ncbi:hypothetical protein [Sinorhizobium meliloti]|uniref:hypothetical protein n=1 Tax=Rhizobium meliloti TaxID=382 RepID=UPI0013E33473|nr:hypothetical protein [Sinorhizobium meliloti]MCO5963656.1 hypothetical protein [Sinorhizobium meliloti]
MYVAVKSEVDSPVLTVVAFALFMGSWHSLKPLGSQQVEKPFVSEQVLQGLDDEQKARLRTSAMSLPLIS